MSHQNLQWTKLNFVFLLDSGGIILLKQSTVLIIAISTLLHRKQWLRGGKLILNMVVQTNSVVVLESITSEFYIALLVHLEKEVATDEKCSFVKTVQHVTSQLRRC